MTKVTTIETADGNIRLDSDVLTGYNQRAHNLLEQISELEKDLKEVVEEAAEETKLKKGVLNKYFKARFKFKTKAAKAEGELFATLDGVLDN